MARCVHTFRPVLFGLAVALLLLAAACVVPPPLEIETQDAGVNSPPNIVQARDSALNSLRPPSTLTVNEDAQPAADLELTLFDRDAGDELTVSLFVDYDPSAPLPPRVKCPVPPASDGSLTRSARCTTAGLCLIGEEQNNPHRLEIEVYDRPPSDVTPYRVPADDGFFTTWTLSLVCSANP